MIVGMKTAFATIVAIIETIAFTLFSVTNVIIYTSIAIVIIGLVIFGLNLNRKRRSNAMFLVFGGETYYPGGGAADLLSSFPDAESAIQYAKQLEGKYKIEHIGSRFEWAHVFSIRDNKIIWQGAFKDFDSEELRIFAKEAGLDKT